jgi:HD superfamily phosphodiesterase
MQYWKPGSIYDARCPECGHSVEFFKDDTTRKCSHCGHRFINPQLDFGCASYCQYAEQCIGNLPPELLAQKEDLLKDRVAIEMKRHFKSDFKRIGHAMKVARYAERIGKQEGGNLAVILCAAYLHGIGKSTADVQSATPPVNGVELESSAIARAILSRLGAKDVLIEEVCRIVGRRGFQPDEPLTFKVVHDADLIASLEAQQKMAPQPADHLEATIAEAFLTASGPKEARTVLLGA